jgi:low affinity Fe/Cu permease
MPSDVSGEPGPFDRFATAASRLFSRATFFAFCVLLVLVWAPSYFLLGSVDTWQLVINTATTIITFLMVFVVQNTQNRDGEAIQAKLDELIRVSEGHNHFIGIEHLTESEVEEIRDKCERAAKRHDERHDEKIATMAAKKVVAQKRTRKPAA